MFRTPTVEDIDIVTKTIVNTKYLPKTIYKSWTAENNQKIV